MILEAVLGGFKVSYRDAEKVGTAKRRMRKKNWNLSDVCFFIVCLVAVDCFTVVSLFATAYQPNLLFVRF